MKSSRRLNRRRRERCHLLVLKFYSLSSFSVFLRLCLSFSRCALSFALFLSLSLSEAFFASRGVQNTNLSEKPLRENTRAHENDRRHKKVLPFIIRSQTDRQEGRKESCTPLAIPQSTRTTFGTLERKEKLCTLSLSLCIYL